MQIKGFVIERNALQSVSSVGEFSFSADVVAEFISASNAACEAGFEFGVYAMFLNVLQKVNACEASNIEAFIAALASLQTCTHYCRCQREKRKNVLFHTVSFVLKVFVKRARGKL